MSDILILKSNSHKVGLGNVQEYSNFFSIDQANWNLISQPDAQFILQDINSSVGNLKQPSGSLLFGLGIGLFVIGFFGFAISAVTFSSSYGKQGISPFYFWILCAIGMFAMAFGQSSSFRASQNFIRDIEQLIISKQQAYASRGLFIQFQSVLEGTHTTTYSGGRSSSTSGIYAYYIKISLMNNSPSIFSQLPSYPHAGSVAIPMDTFNTLNAAVPPTYQQKI